jgi:hypothetical protein
LASTAFVAIPRENKDSGAKFSKFLGQGHHDPGTILALNTTQLVCPFCLSLSVYGTRVANHETTLEQTKMKSIEEAARLYHQYDGPIIPAWIRLPRFGDRCPFTQTTRTQLDHLTRPQKWNHYKPPVVSKILRIDGDGTKRGTRLINFASLMKYLDSLSNDVGPAVPVPKPPTPRRHRVKEVA